MPRRKSVWNGIGQAAATLAGAARLWPATLSQCGLLALLALASNPPQAADLAAGKLKAQACAMCHGETGLSQLPNAPNLAGQPGIYLAEQLKNFRTGRRPDEVMGVIAKPLTDAEIDNLAAWYASNAIMVKPK